MAQQKFSTPKEEAGRRQVLSAFLGGQLPSHTSSLHREKKNEQRCMGIRRRS